MRGPPREWLFTLIYLPRVSVTRVARGATIHSGYFQARYGVPRASGRCNTGIKSLRQEKLHHKVVAKKTEERLYSKGMLS